MEGWPSPLLHDSGWPHLHLHGCNLPVAGNGPPKKHNPSVPFAVLPTHVLLGGESTEASKAASAAAVDDADAYVASWLGRMHVLVVGPGLGRHPDTIAVGAA